VWLVNPKALRGVPLPTSRGRAKVNGEEKKKERSRRPDWLRVRSVEFHANGTIKQIEFAP